NTIPKRDWSSDVCSSDLSRSSPPPAWRDRSAQGPPGKVLLPGSFTFHPQLLARGFLRVHPRFEFLTLLLPRGPAPLLQPRIGAAGAGAGIADEGRFPIEDDIADDDLIPGEGAGLEQPLFHPEGREPVGEVADRFVVLEVRLFDPPLGFIPLYVEVLLPIALLARDGEFVRARPAHGRGAQHDPL